MDGHDEGADVAAQGLIDLGGQAQQTDFQVEGHQPVVENGAANQGGPQGQPQVAAVPAAGLVPQPGPLDGARAVADALVAAQARLLADARWARVQERLWSRVVPCARENEKVTAEWVREVDAAER